MVDAKASADDGSALERRGRPGDGHSWISVPISGLAKARANSTETGWPAGSKVKWVGAALYFVKNIKKAVAGAEIQRETLRPLQFVLEIAEVRELPEAIDRQGLRKRRGVDI